MTDTSLLWSSEDGPSSSIVPKIVKAFFPRARVLDTTYGHGAFWSQWRPRYLTISQTDFRVLAYDDASFDLVVFDPPFQPATVDGLTGARYSKPVKGVSGLKKLIQGGLEECWRVTGDGLIYKCQDYIHDHKPVWMSMWGWEVLGEPWDFVTVRQSSKLRATNWRRQLSVWRNHSTYWIWRKKGRR